MRNFSRIPLTLVRTSETSRNSPTAIIVRKERLHLGSFLEAGDYITLNQLLRAIKNGSLGGSGYVLISWVKNRSLPIHTKRVKQCTFRVVYLNEFWEWAEKHRAFIDWSNLEPLTLGKEPEWVAEQRRLDYKEKQRVKTSPWTKAEDAALIRYLNEYKYTYLQLSKMLQRSSGAIQRRVLDLGIKARPIKADNMIKWTPDEFKLFADLIKQGFDYGCMSDILGKSDKALRGKTGALYQTENLDSVRRMMGDGEWGDGAPPKEARKVGRKPQSKAAKLLLSELCAALNVRMYQLSPPIKGWEDYFQRLSCSHWNDVKGCAKNEKNCDECKNYQRILPQFCKRCGCTFYQREQTDICSPCRKARIQQHLRKIAELRRKGRAV